MARGLAELPEALLGELGQPRSCSASIVAPTAVRRYGRRRSTGVERFDEPLLLEAREGGVEGAGTHRPAGALLDVLHDRVAVLRPVAQADEDEQRRLGEPSELRVLRAPCGLLLLRRSIYR